jgi:hypothetical protein
VSVKRQVLQHKTVQIPAGAPKAKTPMDHMLEGWMPINRKAVKSLQERIRKGEFDSDRKVLLDEIKRDVGLLSYLFKYATEEAELVDDPMLLLSETPLDKVDKVMSKMDDLIHSNAFSNVLKPQALRMRHSLISCVTAEILAEKQGIDPHLAYSVAMVRQLGLALVAWNYPRIYTKALQTVSESEEDIEVILHRILGFSPRQIASQITLKNPSCDLRIGLGLAHSPEEAEASVLGRQLAIIAGLSESFAAMNDPDNFPLITRRWESITSDLTEILGPQALAMLQEKVTKIAENYKELPYLGLDTDLSIEKSLEIANRKFAEFQFNQNAAATKVPEDMQQRLLRVYSLIRPHQTSPEALQMLVIDCIPASGFKRGCVFLGNGHNDLIPRLRIGERGLDAYKTMPNRHQQSNDNPILEALQSPVPVKRDETVMFGERVSSVSGLIGNNDKPGVLYLELDEELAKIGGFEPVQRFKAIRLCLNQCLNLRHGNYG